ncbi:MAG: DNA polymerase sliding clamp, partial [Euryarchaeota archaeon]|nr:DNA polymerase sliding clamp [Euryarchaeota archaeon]
MRLRAMDPAHVAMVDFLLPAGSFDEYECGSELVLGVDLDRLNTILKRAGAQDSVELSAEEDPSTLQIVLHGRAKRKFSLPLISAGGEELRVPEL